MSIEAVKAYFTNYGIAQRVREFDVSSATVDLAAQALGCEPCRIAKTLSFLLDGRPILIVAAGDAKVDNQKYKSRFGAKARMLTPDEAVKFLMGLIGWMKEEERRRLAELAQVYTPYVRALLGAMLEQKGLPTYDLKQRLNGVTSYKIPVTENVLPNKKEWRIV